MLRAGDIRYPWGNRAKARILGVGLRYATVEFLEDSIADFGWYQYVIIEKGTIMKIRRSQLKKSPIGLGS
jgi:hypothetical protein